MVGATERMRRTMNNFNIVQELRNEITKSLADDNVWNWATGQIDSASMADGPIENWNKDLSVIFNKVMEPSGNFYKAPILTTLEEYEARTSYITSAREIEEHFPYVWIEGPNFLTDDYPFDIKYTEKELIRIEGATGYQKEVILHQDTENLLVFATAGSGKTRSITNMVALRIQSGYITPERVAMITFTRKAANEMRNRLKEILGPLAHNIKINTFHGMCRYLLKEMPEHLFQWYEEDANGEKKERKIIDENQSLSQLAAISHRGPELYHKIQRYKLRLISRGSFLPPEWKIYQQYQEALKERFHLDFSDLLESIIDLSENDEARIFLEDQFDLVVVDEYQDSNPLQAQLAILFAGSSQLVVVGDDDQSIFEFQGATPDNILSFEEQHAGNIKKVFLPENFRCSPPIFKAAKNVIAHNKKRAEKKMQTVYDPGKRYDPIIVDGSSDPVQYIKDQIEKWRESGVEYGSIAILGRTNKLLSDVYGPLSQEIPCDYGNLNFLNRMEIKDLKSYLQFIVDEQDSFAFQRVAKTISGVGAKTIEGIMPLLEKNEPLKAIIEKKMVRLTKKSTASLSQFCEKIDRIRDIYLSKEIGEIIELVIKEMSMELAYKESEREERINNIYTFLMAIDRTLSVSQFLKDFETFVVEQNQVNFSTIHKAKGREWDKVVLLGCNDGMLPHFSEEDIEIERRLFFVAITRAKESLVLMYSNDEPQSQFIQEARIGEELGPEDYQKRTEPEKPKEREQNLSEAYVADDEIVERYFEGIPF